MTEKDLGWAVLTAAAEMESDVKLPAASYWSAQGQAE